MKENLKRCASWLPLRNILGRSRDPPTTFSCIQKSLRQHLKIEHTYAEKCLQDKATKKSWMNGWRDEWMDCAGFFLEVKVDSVKEWVVKSPPFLTQILLISSIHNTHRQNGSTSPLISTKIKVQLKCQYMYL